VHLLVCALTLFTVKQTSNNCQHILELIVW